jgi:uncharacterized protein YjbI with pentapeptide repeats/transcriptional regulator with XRE-family HTH domain
MINAMTIGERITTARKRLGLSQSALAQKLSVTPQAVGKWERGESMPDIITFDRMATTLGVSLNYFSEQYQPAQPDAAGEPASAASVSASEEPAAPEPAPAANQQANANELAANQQANADELAANQQGSAGEPVASPQPEATSQVVTPGLTRGLAPRSQQTDETRHGGAQDEYTPADASHGITRDMSGFVWRDADFSGLGHIAERFRGSDIRDCKFVGSDLHGVTFRGNNLVRNDFSGSDLGAGSIKGCNVLSDTFARCSLAGTVVHGCSVRECDFTGADFTDALIKGSDMRKCELASVNWTRTACKGSSFADATFGGELTGCSFDNCGFTRVTFEHATLRDCFFKNIKPRSARNVTFVGCQADNITLAFLKSNRFDVTGIKELGE